MDIRPGGYRDVVTGVLVAVDGSAVARQAAEQALQLLNGADTRVTVVRVVRPVAPALVVGSGMAMATTGDVYAVESSTQSMVAEAEADVTATAERLDVDAATRVVVGDPGPELCRLAAEGDYELLVVGSHGSGFLKRALLGSVSHHVLHHAPCPVLVVRGGAGDELGAAEAAGDR